MSLLSPRHRMYQTYSVQRVHNGHLSGNSATDRSGTSQNWPINFHCLRLQGFCELHQPKEISTRNISFYPILQVISIHILYIHVKNHITPVIYLLPILLMSTTSNIDLVGADEHSRLDTLSQFLRPRKMCFVFRPS